MSENSNIKTLGLLASDIDNIEELVINDQFLQVVNVNPPKQFIKNHPMASGVKYIPIDKIEMMMTKIFQSWYVEILREGQILNSVFVTVRVHYKHPITKEWLHQDGTGAVPIQVDKGQNASNLSAIKSNAITLGLPSAKSYAIKDACEHIGKLFGRDLNRKDTMAFTPSYATEENVSEVEAKKQAIREKLNNESN